MLINLKSFLFEILFNHVHLLICFIGYVKPVICLSFQISRKRNCIIFALNPLKISSCLIVFWSGIAFFFYPIRVPFWYSTDNNDLSVSLILNFGWIGSFVFLGWIFVVCDDFYDLLFAQMLKMTTQTVLTVLMTGSKGPIWYYCRLIWYCYMALSLSYARGVFRTQSNI